MSGDDDAENDERIEDILNAEILNFIYIFSCFFKSSTWICLFSDEIYIEYNIREK